MSNTTNEDAAVKQAVSRTTAAEKRAAKKAEKAAAAAATPATDSKPNVPALQKALIAALAAEGVKATLRPSPKGDYFTILVDKKPIGYAMPSRKGLGVREIPQMVTELDGLAAVVPGLVAAAKRQA